MFSLRYMKSSMESLSCIFSSREKRKRVARSLRASSGERQLVPTPKPMSEDLEMGLGVVWNWSMALRASGEPGMPSMLMGTEVELEDASAVELDGVPLLPSRKNLLPRAAPRHRLHLASLQMLHRIQRSSLSCISGRSILTRLSQPAGNFGRNRRRRQDHRHSTDVAAVLVGPIVLRGVAFALESSSLDDGLGCGNRIIEDWYTSAPLLELGPSHWRASTEHAPSCQGPHCASRPAYCATYDAVRADRPELHQVWDLARH